MYSIHRIKQVPGQSKTSANHRHCDQQNHSTKVQKHFPLLPSWSDYWLSLVIQLAAGSYVTMLTSTCTTSEEYNCSESQQHSEKSKTIHLYLISINSKNNNLFLKRKSAQSHHYTVSSLPTEGILQKPHIQYEPQQGFQDLLEQAADNLQNYLHAMVSRAELAKNTPSSRR